MTMTDTYADMTWVHPDRAFDEAIDAGRLSADENSPIFAGLFMYMGNRGGKALFKNTTTRRYLA